MQHPSSPPSITPEERAYLLEIRRARLLEINAIEARLNMPRTITMPKHERERLRFEQRRGGEGEG